MIEGLETTANLIARYSLFETLYLQHQSTATNRLTRSLIMVYASILTFLGKALHYYDQSAAKRFAKSLVKVSDTTLNELLHNVRTLQAEVEWDSQLVVAELQHKTLDSVTEVNRNTTAINTIVSGMRSDLTAIEDGHLNQLQRLQTLFKTLEDPLFRVSTQALIYQDGLEKAGRLRILEWLSPVPYPQHHDTARMDCLPHSGLWMLQKPQFQCWAASSYSAILWLHGIPGSGKTKLAYAD